MILKVIIDDQLYELNVPEELLAGAGEFFEQMDRDMDKGWQMSRQWVENPDLMDRCRIVGDKLLSALEKENHKLGRLMAGYILNRLPNIDTLEPDTSGEMQNTQIKLKDGAAPATDLRASGAEAPSDEQRQKAREQAEKDVTQVFKVGRHWRFSIYDHDSGQWRDSPTASDQTEAESLRRHALNDRYRSLLDS